MRRHTSSTSASDEPALSTMIMSFLLCSGAREPASTRKKRRPRGGPRPRVVGAAGVRSARGSLCVLAQSAWADLGEVEKVEEAKPRRPSAHCGRYFTGHAAGPSSLFLGLVLARPRPVEAFHDTVPVVVERKAERDDDRHERDRVDVLLLGDVGAEVRGEHRARQPPRRRDDRKDPERHRADPEEGGDDVLREPRDEVEDEADDRALGLEDEIHPVPVVLAEPRPYERLAPTVTYPEADERPDRQAYRRVDDAEPRPEERAADGACDLARDGRDDHLERLERDEPERRHPAPRSHPFLVEVLVLVEPKEPVHGRRTRGEEPDDQRHRREESGRGDRPPGAIGHGLTGAVSQRRTALAPGPRLLERRRGGEDGRVGVPAPDDLQADRQPVAGPARRDGGGRLAGEVERERERHPAEDRDAPASDLARRRLACGEREHRDGRHQQEVEALEERVDL